jgi:hypothetical protein
MRARRAVPSVQLHATGDDHGLAEFDSTTVRVVDEVGTTLNHTLQIIRLGTTSFSVVVRSAKLGP